MSTVEKSLRMVIEKWFDPTTVSRVRLSRFGRAWLNGNRVVRVETLPLESSIAIFFFQHRDGTWRVFPPEPERPSMWSEYL